MRHEQASGLHVLRLSKGTTSRRGFNPATGQPDSAPLPQQERSPQSDIASEGWRGNSPSPFPGLSKQAERAVPGKSSAEAGVHMAP